MMSKPRKIRCIHCGKIITENEMGSFNCHDCRVNLISPFSEEEYITEEEDDIGNINYNFTPNWSSTCAISGALFVLSILPAIIFLAFGLGEELQGLMTTSYIFFGICGFLTTLPMIFWLAHLGLKKLYR